MSTRTVLEENMRITGKNSRQKKAFIKTIMNMPINIRIKEVEKLKEENNCLRRMHN